MSTLWNPPPVSGDTVFLIRNTSRSEGSFTSSSCLLSPAASPQPAGKPSSLIFSLFFHFCCQIKKTNGSRGIKAGSVRNLKTLSCLWWSSPAAVRGQSSVLSGETSPADRMWTGFPLITTTQCLNQKQGSGRGWSGLEQDSLLLIGSQRRCRRSFHCCSLNVKVYLSKLY